MCSLIRFFPHEQQITPNERPLILKKQLKKKKRDKMRLQHTPMTSIESVHKKIRPLLERFTNMKYAPKLTLKTFVFPPSFVNAP